MRATNASVAISHVISRDCFVVSLFAMTLDLTCLFRIMEIIDSHTHWGPSVSMGTEVTTQEILKQAEQSSVSRIVIFPFPSMALADENINVRLLKEANRIKKFIPYYYIPEANGAHP